MLSDSVARAATSRYGCDAAPEGSATVSLDLLGGDVWGWSKSIKGTCLGVAANATVAVLVNGDPVPATRTGNSFSATVRLRPGDNTIHAVATLGDSTDTSDQVIHTARLLPRPTARIAVSIGAGGISLDGTGSETSEYDESPIVGYSWSFRANHPGEQSASGTDPAPCAGIGPTFNVPVPGSDGEYLASLTVLDEHGREDTDSVLVAVEGGRARQVDAIVEQAAWVNGATIYGVVVRNFGAGRFQDVIDHLDDLADLGIAALWLAPITGSIPGHFGYEVTEYFNVRPEYGTLDDFKRMVDEAHARGIRVLLDFVPNHTSIEHPYYRGAERDGPASPYYDLYDRDEGGVATHYFDWTHLPNLDFDNPDVRRFATEALMFWVREMNVDGFRVDVAWGIRQRRPEYWREFNAEFKRVKPDGLLIAEASARDPFYAQNGFDAAYDWTDELGIWAWADVFAGDAPVPEGLRRALASTDGSYHPDSLVFRFLNNNDTGPRFITTHGVDLYRVASALLLTLPGLPCVYTGDEVGAEFEPYRDSGAIDWTDHHDVRAHFCKLIHLRRDLPGLRSREWAPLAVEPASQVFGYLRFTTDGASPILVLLNFSPDATEASLDRADLGPAFGGTIVWTDVYNETPVAVGDGARLTIAMPAWGFRILILAEDAKSRAGMPGHLSMAPA